MSENQQFKPGDVANGHILGSDGVWHPQQQPMMGFPPPAPVPPRKKSVWGRWWMIVGYVVVGMVIIGMATGGGEGDGDASASDSSSGGGSSKATPDMRVEANRILKDFEANEAAADAKYDGKVLAVSGVVDKVDTEIWDDEKYVVRVNGGGDWDILTVNCNGLSAAAVQNIEKGSTVTVVGRFDDGGDLGVELNDCSL